MLKPYSKAEVFFQPRTEIGSDGRNSKTYVSHDFQLDAEIVIKQVAKSRLRSPANFFDESRALYASTHPNVVQIYYACQDDDNIYIAMPYYQRGSVKTLISGKYMTVREIIVVGCQVVSALHNVHSKGLIHFDVKPDNILLSDRGEALLSDFGLAKPAPAGLANPGLFYTPMIPPEVPGGATSFNLTWDIYQLGLTLYRMCNGNEEFKRQFGKFIAMGPAGDKAFKDAVKAGEFPDRKTFPAHIPDRLRSVVRTCLEPDPGKRYASALEVANSLAGIDDLLDWRLNASPGGVTVWSKRNDGGAEYVLTQNTDGSTIFYQIAPGGTRRRVTAGCKTSMNWREIRKILGEH
jgi:eukaryotic-like serine/threonine-protein kinase